MSAGVDTQQRHLDALLAEQRDLPAAITAAARGDDPTEWARLALRQSVIVDEIHAAHIAAIKAQLDRAWTQIPPCVAAAQDTRAHLDQAQAAYQNHHAIVTQQNDPGGRAYAALIRERAELREAAIAAQVAHANAEHAAALAHLAVDELEDALELAGERPTQPPRPAPLAATFALTIPSNGADQVRTFLAGEIPPRWAAYKLRNSAHAATP